jgi:histidyl-tRNA synthetase
MIKRPDGTVDLLPEDIAAWNRVERIVRGVLARYGYGEVRPPVFENTNLFYKSTGETTDIVEKEMFTVPPRGQTSDSYTFRPELTPGAIRALIEAKAFAERTFWKVFYWGTAFRYERPQKGRLRQFTQFGVEALGSEDPLIDAETIAVFADILREAGVARYDVRINTIGCADCRGKFREKLKGILAPQIARYCENCRKRLDRNVFRILDCKVDVEKTASLPPITENVCDACKAHFAGVQAALKATGVAFALDPRIVRGLDYYTRTVYEFSSPDLGSQSALGGGGRYDGLVESMGGPKVGGVGFAAGVERVLIALEAAKVATPAAAPPDFYAISASDAARSPLFTMVQTLRGKGLAGDLDFERRSLKAQFRTANRCGARYALIVGDEELAKAVVKLKNMGDGVERTVTLDEAAAVLAQGRSS